MFTTPANARTILKCLAIVAGIAIAGVTQAPAKTFRVNIVADPAQMDPITYSELVSGRIIRNMYEGFTTITEDGTNAARARRTLGAAELGPGFPLSSAQGRRVPQRAPVHRQGHQVHLRGAAAARQQGRPQRHLSEHHRRREGNEGRHREGDCRHQDRRRSHHRHRLHAGRTCCSRSIRSISWTAASWRSSAPTG